jgi:hypothetical protein
MLGSDGFCNIYNTTSGISDNVKIISGRVSVHAILASTSGSGSTGDDGKTIALSATNGGNSLIEIALRYPRSGSIGPGADDNFCFLNSFQTGGNGVLFTDGVWIRLNTGPGPSGIHGSIRSLQIFYTGGANT